MPHPCFSAAGLFGVFARTALEFLFWLILLRAIGGRLFNIFGQKSARQVCASPLHGVRGCPRALGALNPPITQAPLCLSGSVCIWTALRLNYCAPNSAQHTPNTNTGVKFEDVAGVDDAKLELQELVDFLKNPGKYVHRDLQGVACNSHSPPTRNDLE